MFACRVIVIICFSNGQVEWDTCNIVALEFLSKCSISRAPMLRALLQRDKSEPGRWLADMVGKKRAMVTELPGDLDRLHCARGEQDRDLRPMDANPPRQLEAIGPLASRYR